MTPKTYSVESAYTGRDGIHRAYVKGHPQPFKTDDLLPEGAAVTIHGDRATRYFNHKDS